MNRKDINAVFIHNEIDNPVISPDKLPYGLFIEYGDLGPDAGMLFKNICGFE